MTYVTTRASPNSIGKAIKKKKKERKGKKKAKPRPPLTPTLSFHLSKLLVVFFERFPKLLVLRFDVVQALHFELELLPEVQGWHGICTR